MSDNLFRPICNCADVGTPEIEDISEQCPPDSIFSEVQRIFISDGIEHPEPVDWTNAANWTSILDNTNTDGTKIKWLRVIGNVAFTKGGEILNPGHVKTTLENTYVLDATITGVTALIYEFLATLENCPSLPYIWFETVGGYLFGMQAGIKLTEKTLPFELAEGEDAYERYHLIMSWKSKTRPLRIVSPVPNIA
jgi:hypothetical protein